MNTHSKASVARVADKYAPKDGVVLGHVPESWGAPSAAPIAVGHNGPPPDETPRDEAPRVEDPSSYDAIRQEIEDLFLEAKNWADGEPISDQKQADAVTELL